MLIGIGCNIVSAPVVPLFGKEAGRSSTCLALHGPSSSSQYTSNNIDNNDNDSSSSGSSSDGVSLQPPPTEADVDVTGQATTTAIDATATVTPIESNINDTDTYYTNLCNELALEITGAISYYLTSSSHPTIDSGNSSPSDSVDDVIRDFERHMDFTPQILRKEYKHTAAATSAATTTTDGATTTTTTADGTSTAGSSGVGSVAGDGGSVVGSVKGAEVVPIGLNRDGTLLVELTATGERRALVAEYLW